MNGPAWVAGSTRARLLCSRRLGRIAARRLADAPSTADAIRQLAATPYGREVQPSHSQVEAEWGISQVTLWHLRILAGWLPPAGAEMVRLLAGYWEIANVEGHLAGLEGRSHTRSYALGSLATAWPRLRMTRSRQELQAALTASAWGDPGADDAAGILAGMRLSWGVRAAQDLPQAAEWAGAWLLLVVARDLYAGDQGVVRRARPRLGPLGWDWPEAASLLDLVRRCPRSATWVMDGVADPSDLWQAEARWWTRLESDGFELVSRPRPGSDIVLGAVALLATDAWRAKGALQVAGRGEAARETYDALG